MKTIAQQINWDFETNGDLEIQDKNCKRIYLELSDGYWSKREYDSLGNEIYYETSNEYMEKREWDCQGIVIYYEDSNGQIIDNRPKPCEGKIVEIGGEKFKLVKV